MDEMVRDPIRLGMVGGGTGAFIGQVHRIAARIDGAYRLVAGALSSRPEVARESGAALGFAPDRVYTDFYEMAREEAIRPDGIEAVAIVTPNHLHFEPARAFLDAGIHVICDKPMTTRLEDAVALARIARDSSARFLLTHTYSGYPLVREARKLVAEGVLGRLRLVQVEYMQDWLARPADPDNRQAAWRGDPAKAGAGGAIGDIGTHAFHLARYITQLPVTELSAQLHTFVPGRQVDDHAQISLRFEGGALGTVCASQVVVGCENGLKIRVVGEEATLEWQQESPNHLWLSPFGGHRQLITRGGPVPAGSPQPVRVPPGHPEGYLEAFASLYCDFAALLRGRSDAGAWLPGIEDGLEGVRFIDTCVRSSAGNGAWRAMPGGFV